MTDTVVSSAKKEVVIGFERRFVMIGEGINPTGRKSLAAEMAAGNYSPVVAEALAQVEAGAQMLDVNAGIPLADEPRILAERVKLVQETVDVPLSIDSSIVEALAAGLAVYRGRPLVNSVAGEEERLERVLPLVKKYDAAVIAISNDETDISEDPDVRYAVAKKIVERAMDRGIKREDVVVDPLVMPVGAIGDAGARLMHLLRRLHGELKVNTSCGASNFSFGLPNRRGLAATFLPMMIGWSDLGDHESAARRRHPGDSRRRRGDGPRSQLRPMDPQISRDRAGGRGGRRRAARGTPARPSLSAKD
jgi:5-methyltetrahydrofolate--homocysteine methyltransferase